MLQEFPNSGRLEIWLRVFKFCNLLLIQSCKYRSSFSLGVDKGDHDVSGALGGVQPLVVVSQSARVHEDPAHPGARHLAVVTQEPTAAALKIFSNIKIFFQNKKTLFTS